MKNDGCGCCSGCLIVLAVFLPIAIIVGTIIALIKSIPSNKKEVEVEEIEEEERKKAKCCICNDPSDGDTICSSCYECSKVIKKELPFEKTKNYDAVNKYYEELMIDAIVSDTQKEREAACLKLLALEDILDEKYKKPAINKTIDFFYDLKYSEKDSLFKKYNLKKRGKSKEKEDKYDPNHKRYKSEDGHIVRSKGEREIDNFFYKNNIDHVYEKFYKHPKSGETFLPDFYLPEYNLYIEYFGKYGDENYDKDRDKKIPMYQSDYSINFEYLTYEDDYNVTEKLKSICKKYSIPFK